METEELSWRERGRLWLRLGIRLGLTVLAVALVVRFGGRALSLFAPFLAAWAAAAVLNPVVRWLQRRLGGSRQLITLVLLLGLFGLLGAGVSFLLYAAGQELVSLVQNWGDLLGKLQQILDQLEVLLTQLWSLVPPRFHASMMALGEEAMDWLTNATPDLLNRLLNYTGGKAMALPSVLVAVLMFVLATYFLTADYPYLRTRMVQRVDEGVLQFLSQVRLTALGVFGGYLKAEILLSVGVFFILLGGFLITKQPYGLLLAFALAVFDFIPLVGAGTVMVPWAGIALLTRDYPTAIRIMVIWGIVALFRRVMEPKFVGDQTGLSPIASLISIYVGMKTAGVLGMVFAPVLLLVVLNLTGMGMLRGLRLDVSAAVRDVAAILSRRPEDTASSKKV